MPAEPTQKDIDTVVGIVQCDPEVAKRYLKVKENNIDRAIGALFDGEDISGQEAATTWDDKAFSSDREGGAVYGPPNAAYTDDQLHPLGRSAAPTRGNSPVPSFKRPNTKAEEDAEMEQALAMSRQDVRYDGQETGVVGADGKTTASSFRPATSGQYDPSKWTMTVAGSALAHEASEVTPDVDAHDRRQIGDEPRFIKVLTTGDYLPAFLTIAHSIPAAREALLLRSVTRTSYGQDPDWWRGSPIRLPRIVHITDGSDAGPLTREHDEVVSEVQRLMALLDRSTRAYGSADTLAKSDMVRTSSTGSASESLLDQTLLAWQGAANNLDPQNRLNHDVFHSSVGTNSKKGLTPPDMWVLPMKVTTEEDSTVTLAEVMDATLWDTNTDEDGLCENYMEQCADILPMKVTAHDTRSDLKLIVPPHFYVDRYMKENVEATRGLRKEMVQMKQRMSRIDVLHKDITRFRHSKTGNMTDVSPFVQHTVGHFSGKNRQAVLKEREERGLDLSKSVPQSPANHQDISMRLDAFVASVERQLDALTEAKDQARQALSRLSQTLPPDLSAHSLKHRYSLRGVSTKSNVTYVLRPAGEQGQGREDADEMFPDSERPQGMQWWRIAYDVNANGASISRTLTDEEEVIRAVELEHSQALLVYASDRAINFQPDPRLPEALEEFIRRDDELFAADLAQPSYYSRGYSPEREIEEPQPRTSLDSTTVNFDDDQPPAYADDVPFSLDDDKQPLLGGDEDLSPPAHEIRLDEFSDAGGEMAERTPGGFVVGHGDEVGPSERGSRLASDASMRDAFAEFEDPKAKVD